MYAGYAPSRAKECVNASFVTVVRSATDDSSYLSDVQYYRASDGNASAGAAAEGAMVRELRLYDVERQRLGPKVASLPVLDCATTLAPYWQGARMRQFGEFAWFGPYDPGVGWGYHFEGNEPLIGDDGRDVGRCASAVSLRGLTDTLAQALQRGGSITEGGHALIITREQGLVLGNTEDALNSNKPNATSLLYDALRLVKAQHGGSACPEQRWLAGANETSIGRLVSLEPFDPGQYGLPPLTDAWCIITSIPARNVFAARDRTRFLSVMVAVAGGVGILLAMLALGAALVIARRRTFQLEQEKAHRAEHFVTMAMKSLTEVSYPFVLVSAKDMMAAGRMLSHEELRAQGKLLVLDTLQDLAAFKRAGNRFCFVSHQWLSESHPDPECAQYSALMTAMLRITVGHLDTKIARPLGAGTWYLWLDYHSVPQHHKVRCFAASLLACRPFACPICAPSARL